MTRHRAPIRFGVAALCLLAFATTSVFRGLGVGLLVLAGTILLLAIGLIWTSVQSLTGEAPLTLDEALGMAAPSAEEEQKRAVLRALKDLEYERSVGKISDEDYNELSARYRRQAKELLRSMDESLAGGRQRAAELVERRLGGAPEASDATVKKRKKFKAKAKPAGPSPVARPEAPAVPVETPPELDEGDEPDDDDDDELDAAPKPPARPTRRCLACDVRNELDARFCKRCGKSMAEDGEYACLSCPARFDAELTKCPDCGVERVDA